MSCYLSCFLKLKNSIVFQDFKDGKVDTAFIPKHEDELQAVSEVLTSTSVEYAS